MFKAVVVRGLVMALSGLSLWAGGLFVGDVPVALNSYFLVGKEYVFDSSEFEVPGRYGVAPYREYVSYSDPVAFQAAVDACEGSVLMRENFASPVLAEHDYCGGSDFPVEPGAVVEVVGSADGVVDGLYEVVGLVVVLNKYEHTRFDVPGGYDLMFQTCLDGPEAMGFYGLQRL